MWVWFVGFLVEIGLAWVVVLSSPMWVVGLESMWVMVGYGGFGAEDRGGSAGLEF